MASTTFVDFSQNTPIVAAWLNDVNKGVYNADGTHNLSAQTPFAWVRFTGATGAIVSSSNVASVTRTGAGAYTILYGATLPVATNCYSINTNLPGFDSIVSETTTSVSILVANTSNVATDASIVCVQIFAVH